MFRNYCYEKWQGYQEETCVAMKNRGYNYECLNWKDYFNRHRWWLRRMYRYEFGNLTKKWKGNVGTIPPYQ